MVADVARVAAARAPRRLRVRERHRVVVRRRRDALLAAASAAVWACTTLLK